MDRYRGDVLGRPARRSAAPCRGSRPSRDLVVEDAETGFCGAVVRTEKTPAAATVTLEDRHGRHRVVPARARASCVDGAPVDLVRPAPAGRAAPARRTASGSVRRARRAGPGRPRQPDLRRGPARRRAGREGVGRRPAGRGRRRRAPGRHRRPAGRRARSSRPGPERRLGVLVDHLVAGSKECPAGRAGHRSPHVRVVGHPYVDVWQAVRPAALGIAAWPEVPRGTPWKEGVCAGAGLAGRPARPPGAGSCAPSRRTPTWSRACSAGSRSSSTS